jgi:4-amino-4-deoxy-L-arabinose transferase-like glycosyltransferase
MSGAGNRLRLLEVTGLVATLAASVVAAVLIPEPPPRGLAARYWDNATWSGAPVATARASELSLAAIRRTLPEAAYPVFSVEWTGYLLVESAGRYTFDLKSDDGAGLYIGEPAGQPPIVDNFGIHGAQVATGSVDLPRGPVRIRLMYAQAGGAAALDLAWTPPGGRSGALPMERLSPEAGMAIRPEYWRRRDLAARTVTCIWAGLFLYLPLRVLATWLYRSIRATKPDRATVFSLAGLGLLATGLCAWGIDWSLPAWSTWAPDELDPAQIRAALARGFAFGWFEVYGPLSYYIPALPLSAFAIADRIGLLSADVSAYSLQFLWMRSTSAVMALATLGTTYLIGAELSGPRRGVFAAATLLCTPTFAYYSKTANVDIPYVFWLSVALLAFVRILSYGRLKDHVLLGAAAAAAVGTKDQAYGFFVLVPLAVLAREVRRRTEKGASIWLSAAVDRKLVAGGLASVGTLALIYLLPLNLSGFLRHIEFVQASGTAFREYEASWAGQLSLAGSSVAVLRWACGWPMFILALLGVAKAWLRRDRRWWLWLLLPVLSYYLTFVAVALYVYDRFLIGVQVVLALFAGAAAADLLEGRKWRVLPAAVLVAAYGYSGLNALSVDIMMARDSRQDAEAWIARCIPRRASIAVVGTSLYSPRFSNAEPTWLLDSGTTLRASRFDYVVVNTRYARRQHSRQAGASQMDYLDGAASGYRRVARFHGQLPFWAVLAREPVFSAALESGFSNIDKINPEIVVFADAHAAVSCEAPDPR